MKHLLIYGCGFLLLCLLAACQNPPPSERIIGTWHSCKKHEPEAQNLGGIGFEFDDVVTFYEDGTLRWVRDVSEAELLGTYEFMSGPDNTSFDVRGEISISLNSREANFRYIMPNDQNLYGFILGSYTGSVMTFCEAE